MGVRFLFVFFLARYLDPASVGYYGLFTAAIGYSIYFVGLDFYTYTTREILQAPPDRRGRMLKGQAALSGLLYLALLPVALGFLSWVSWPGHLVWWFLPILMLEHFNQEMSRLLVALSEQVFASVVLFVRLGSWALMVPALMHWWPETRSLDTVLALWAVSGLAAAALGGWKLWRLRMGGWRNPVDWGWVRKGIAVSMAFLAATLALRGLQTMDRYWLEALAGIETVGAYVLLLGVASALLVFLDAGVFAYAYPALIAHNHRKEHDLARARVRKVLVQTLAISAGFGLCGWILIPHLLAWLDNPVYSKSMGLYPWLMAAMTLNAIGMVPHYALYAQGRDRPIIASHLAALPVFVLFTWGFSGIAPGLAVLIGLNAAFALILLWKAAAYWTLNRNEDTAEMLLQTS